MKVYENGKWVEKEPEIITDEELNAEKQMYEEQQRIEATRPLTADEVVAKIIPSVINNAPIDDKTALRCKEFYPTFKWCCDNNVKAEEKGYKFTDNDRKQLFKTLQPNFKFTAVYPPTEGTESLYERIDEAHEGTKTDPIPYEGNMELFKGKYYTQGKKLYICTRNTQVAVYNPLSDLVKIYVEEITK